MRLVNVVSTVHDKVLPRTNALMRSEMSEGKRNETLFAYITLQRFYFRRDRLIGLCLLQNELFPLFLQRHVLKYILGRTIRFHDLAFFDPVVYESLRQLVTESAKINSTILTSLELNFV